MYLHLCTRYTLTNYRLPERLFGMTFGCNHFYHVYQCVDLDGGLRPAAPCLDKGEGYGLKRCILPGNIAFGSRKSADELTDVGLGEPDELGVEDGGGVIGGRCEGGGPSKPEVKPACIGDCQEPTLWLQRPRGTVRWPR